MSRTIKRGPKPYARFYSTGCLNNGSCPWCQSNRRFKHLRQARLSSTRRGKEQMKNIDFSEDF